MGRTILSPQRLADTKKANIGQIIIFCEGITEKHYFDYFADIIKKNKYTDIKVEIESANGNAQKVLNYANEFLEVEENNRKFRFYDKYLVFDCDAPKNIQAVIAASQSKEEPSYRLLLSNYLFETWLLMHFEDIKTKLTKKETYQRLSLHLNQQYSKAHKGKIRQIINTGNIEKAIDNGRNLDVSYLNQGKSIFIDIKEMNPYSNVYTLIEQFLVQIS